MKKCPAEEKLGAYLDGELPEAAAIEAHVRTCKACAEELAAFAEVKRLSEGLAAPEVSSREWAATWSAIADRVAAKQPRAPGLWEALVRLRRVLVPAAAAALVVAVGLFALRSDAPASLPPTKACVIEYMETAEGYSAMPSYSAEGDVTIITLLPAASEEALSDHESRKHL